MTTYPRPVFHPLFKTVASWYQRHARSLPWRDPGTTPWGVLVCEVMAQQTPVSRVVPRWELWMNTWPTPADLAAASQTDVLIAWDRLGYPRRALRLHECARVIVRDHGGQLPDTVEALRSLPGIGEYTAAAVLAFAFAKRALVLDTNIRRVLARAVDGKPRPAASLTRAERARAEALLPKDDSDAALWSIAVMELGALVCTVRSPQCDVCPWTDVCAWQAAGFPEDEASPRRRPQAWHGTDRQARGHIMAALRETRRNTALTREILLTEAARAGNRMNRPDPAQPERALASLLADGLVITEDSGLSFRLPT